MIELTWAVLNRGMGTGFWEHIPDSRLARAFGCACMALIGSIVTLLYNHYNHFIIPILFCGLFLWRTHGRGLYFAACTGKWDKEDSQIKWIDWIGYKAFPFVTATQHASNYARGVLCMGVASLVYSLPLWVGLSLVLNKESILFWPIMALEGFIYFICSPAYKYKREAIAFAEPLIGAGVAFLYRWALWIT